MSKKSNPKNNPDWPYYEDKSGYYRTTRESSSVLSNPSKRRNPYESPYYRDKSGFYNAAPDVAGVKGTGMGMTCPGCRNPISGNPSPGAYTCQGCGAAVQVSEGPARNPGQKRIDFCMYCFNQAKKATKSRPYPAPKNGKTPHENGVCTICGSANYLR